MDYEFEKTKSFKKSTIFLKPSRIEAEESLNYFPVFKSFAMCGRGLVNRQEIIPDPFQYHRRAPMISFSKIGTLRLQTCRVRDADH